MMNYTVQLKRSFLVTAHGVSADSPEEAVEKAWDYFDDGEVTFDEIINHTVSIAVEGDKDVESTSES
jgi:hypothetical protein